MTFFNNLLEIAKSIVPGLSVGAAIAAISGFAWKNWELIVERLEWFRNPKKQTGMLIENKLISAYGHQHRICKGCSQPGKFVSEKREPLDLEESMTVAHAGLRKYEFLAMVFNCSKCGRTWTFKDRVERER